MIGRVGMETGCVGLEDRLRRRRGKVGDVGEVWGVLRRTKVEMGVFAESSVSERVSLCGRLELLFGAMDDDLRLMIHVAGDRYGDVDRARDGTSTNSSLMAGTLLFLAWEIVG